MEVLPNNIESMEIKENNSLSSIDKSAAENEMHKQPICIIILGMAGAGKTTFVSGLSKYLQSVSKTNRIINLDPAVKVLPYAPYIDIRDTVNYKEIMKQYGLGPNGGIVTSLNLFSTMMEDVINLIKKKKDDVEFMLFDTPGQIEVFNWSASGSIIAGTISSFFPTINIYIYDTVQSMNTQSFMSNMLYACSILYKYQLPLMIAMNKVDIMSCQYAVDWMTDYDRFQDAAEANSSYCSNLTRSLSMVIEEFYKNIKTCGVSAKDGTGMEELLKNIYELAKEYEIMREEKLKAKIEMEAAAKEDDDDDFSNARKQIRSDTEMYLNADSETSEEEPDEEGNEESKEKESFYEFIKKHKESRNQPEE